MPPSPAVQFAPFPIIITLDSRSAPMPPRHSSHTNPVSVVRSARNCTPFVRGARDRYHPKASAAAPILVRWNASNRNGE